MAVRERWESGGGYEPYVGRWSRLVAARFLEWLEPVPDAHWLDVGCGTGALTETILGTARPESVTGVDPSKAFVSYSSGRIADPRAEFEVGDAQHIPGESDRYDCTVSALVLNFVPDPVAAVEEMKRVTRSGGLIAAYVWDYLDGMEMMRYFWDAAAERDPLAAAHDEGARFTICTPEPLRSLWDAAGLAEVRVVPLEVDTVFRDFDDFWRPFLGGQGSAPTYNMSLDESSRESLKGLLRQRLPVEDDGSIHLRARAWAVRGVVVGA